MIIALTRSYELSTVNLSLAKFKFLSRIVLSKLNDTSLGCQFNINLSEFTHCKANKMFCRFTINIQNGPDVAFHFDVRLKHGNDRNTIVRNSMQNKVWGGEERQLTYFPFVPDVFFELLLLVEQYSYKVYSVSVKEVLLSCDCSHIC